VVKRGVRGIYEVLWYDTGAGEVRSLVNRAVVAEYIPGLGWEDYGRLPDDVREYAQQIVSGAGAGGGVVPHHETSGRSESQPKKSHAQIKREVDEILAGKRSRGQKGLSSEDARRLEPLPDAAICNASQGGSKNLWYATVALDTRCPSDPDFLTTRKTKQAAIHDCAAKVRADLHGEGKYAPHWSDYDVIYRLLPYWEQRRS
jgi:hypothetical protein